MVDWHSSTQEVPETSKNVFSGHSGTHSVLNVNPESCLLHQSAETHSSYSSASYTSFLRDSHVSLVTHVSYWSSEASAASWSK